MEIEKRKINKHVATLTVELYQRGAIIICDELGTEYKVDNGNEFMDVLNEITEACDPDATFVLTEEGKEFVEFLEYKKNKEKNGNKEDAEPDEGTDELPQS